VATGNAFVEYNLSDLTADGVTYTSGVFTVAVDSNGATGAKMIGGINRLSSTTDAVAFTIGASPQQLAAVSFGAPYPYSERRGVAMSQDGMTAYVVASVPSGSEVLEMLPLPAIPPDGSPSPPTNAVATAGVGAAAISWNAPVYPGKSAITGYTVKSSDGATVSVNGTTFNALLAGLSPVSHTFTVTATNSNGTSAPSAASNSVTPLAGGTFHPVTPQRILDTRTGNGGYPIRRVGAGSTLSLQVTGRGGVPSTGVSAVVLNVTVTDTTGGGYVVAYPTGLTRPLASNINFTGGATVPNLVEVGTGLGGRVDLYVGGAAADLIADVEGWVGDSTNSYFAQGLYNAQGPVRVWDSRYISTANGNVHQPLGPGQTLTLQITGLNAIPSGAEAVVLNVTATGPTRAGYFTVYPADAARPLASNVNFAAGQTVPNRVIVGLSSDGKVTIFNGYGTVDVVVDISGWFNGSFGNNSGSALITGQPVRIFDSRNGVGKVPPGYLVYFHLTGDPISALVLNVTATNPTANGYLTVYQDNGSQGQTPPPLASDLNFRPGQTVANMTVVRVMDTMAFDIYNGAGYTDIVVDVDGVYGPVIAPLASTFTPAGTAEPRAPSSLPITQVPPALRAPHS
jgi:hypothetical protein